MEKSWALPVPPCSSPTREQRVCRRAGVTVTGLLAFKRPILLEGEEMTAVFKDIEAQALALPERERGALVARLLDSLESAFDDSPEAVAQAWDEEIARRVADFEAGHTQGIPYEQVRAELEAMLRAHKTP